MFELWLNISYAFFLQTTSSWIAGKQFIIWKYLNKKYNLIFSFSFSFQKYILIVGSFEGEHFIQASGVLVQVLKPTKNAARWRCGLPMTILRVD